MRPRGPDLALELFEKGDRSGGESLNPYIRGEQ